MSDAIKALFKKALVELGCEGAKLLGNKISAVATAVQQTNQTVAVVQDNAQQTQQ